MHQVNKLINLLVLGTAQDGGYPHTGCFNKCCSEVWNGNNKKRLRSSLALLSENRCYLFDITPDIKYQLQIIEDHLKIKPIIAGIFITHAHFGHYSGLMELGLEVMNSNSIPVYVFPRMKSFLENNAPFIQLVNLKNIKLIRLLENKPVYIEGCVQVIPFQVPHRNEYSETVGYSIKTNARSALYIPDIDSWKKWKQNINTMIKEHDVAFLDGTFYRESELLGRNIKDVPHPTIKESIKQFSSLEGIDRKKVNFIHLNHTNSIIRENSQEKYKLIKEGFRIAEDGMKISL